ncbi:MAG: anaerobic ribonucleoside-triphosphate reductase activating protein [Paludibacteraceae bacterium]|nr:anaerobic ribonucleoside-triphosphate reductase activating protein [Paludibacteraceae bacterium]
MLKYADYDIVFQEVPDETTLAINLSLCPNRCPGCHSVYLQGDAGEELTPEAIDLLIDKYGALITCVSLMGGDNDPLAVNQMAQYIHSKHLKTAWYSGRENLPQGVEMNELDYIKLGPYIESLGGMDKPTTNQHLYKITDGKWEDITYRLRKN